MNSRERVLTALRRKQPDRAPTCARFSSGFMRIFNCETNANLPERLLKPGGSGFISETFENSITPEEYFNYDFRHFVVNPTRYPNDYSKYFDNLPEEAQINEWGIAIVRDETTFSEHRTGPLRNINDTRELLNYPIPDVTEQYRYEGISQAVLVSKEAGFATVGFLPGTIFELICDLRGYENFFIDIYTSPEITAGLIDLVTDLRIEQVKNLTLTGVDILRVGDNFGMQKQMLIHPDMWRRWFKPGLKKLIETVKSARPDIYLSYKSDGNIEPIIPDLIDIGVDILCPIQAEAMDPYKIKANFGDKLSLWGTISTQQLLPHGTPAQIKATIRRFMEDLGKDGGLVLTPDHIVLPDVPWKNIVAMFDAIHNYKK